MIKTTVRSCSRCQTEWEAPDGAPPAPCHTCGGLLWIETSIRVADDATEGGTLRCPGCADGGVLEWEYGGERGERMELRCATCGWVESDRPVTQEGPKPRPAITWAELQSPTFQDAHDVASYRCRHYRTYEFWTEDRRRRHCLRKGFDAVLAARKEAKP